MEALRDLLVAKAVGRELGDPLLRRGQLAGRLRPSSADLAALGARMLGPAGGAELVERGRRLVERLARRAPFPLPPLRPPEVEQRARAVDAKAERSVIGRGAGEVRCRLVRAGVGREPQERVAALR